MKLKDYLYFEKITITDFAKMLGVSRVQMSGVANGFRYPSKSLVNLIQLITNGKVTSEDFQKEKKSM